MTTISPALATTARDFSEALGDLIRVVQFRDRDRACCYDISVSQCYALEGVVEAGPMTINDLAAHLYLDKSTASRVANGLVDKGLVERRRDPSDGRVVRLEATDEGLRIHTAIARDLTTEYAELLADFEPEVRTAVTEILGRLGQSFACRVDASGGSCCTVTPIDTSSLC